MTHKSIIKIRQDILKLSVALVLNNWSLHVTCDGLSVEPDIVITLGPSETAAFPNGLTPSRLLQATYAFEAHLELMVWLQNIRYVGDEDQRAYAAQASKKAIEAFMVMLSAMPDPAEQATQNVPPAAR